MNGRTDAATLLERALLADAARLRVPIRIREATATRWASATFVGARHRLTIEAARRSGFDAWLTALPEADLPLRRHLVADVMVVEHIYADGRATAIVEVLTVEEA